MGFSLNKYIVTETNYEPGFNFISGNKDPSNTTMEQANMMYSAVCFSGHSPYSHLNIQRHAKAIVTITALIATFNLLAHILLINCKRIKIIASGIKKYP